MDSQSKRVVKAKLSKRGKNVLGRFCKYAQQMVDEVSIGKSNFPDNKLRKALRNLIGSIEDNLEAVAEIANAVGDSEIVEIVQDAADSLAPLDPDEGMEQQPENHPSTEPLPKPEDTGNEEVVLSENTAPIDESALVV